MSPPGGRGSDCRAARSRATVHRPACPRRGSSRRHGIYADYLEAWLEIFDRKQILILNSEDLKNSTKETLHSVFDFLNVSEHYIGNTSQVNVGKYPLINKNTRKKLIEFFKPHNQRLNKLLDTEFDWDR